MILEYYVCFPWRLSLATKSHNGTSSGSKDYPGAAAEGRHGALQSAHHRNGEASQIDAKVVEAGSETRAQRQAIHGVVDEVINT